MVTTTGKFEIGDEVMRENGSIVWVILAGPYQHKTWAQPKYALATEDGNHRTVHECDITLAPIIYTPRQVRELIETHERARVEDSSQAVWATFIEKIAHEDEA